MRGKISVLVILLFCSAMIYAEQRDSIPRKIWYAETLVSYGNAIKNFPSFPASSQCIFLEMGAGVAGNGYRHWHKQFGYPLSGFSLVYADFGNAAVLGKSIALMPDVRFFFTRGRFVPWLRLGTGVAYFNRAYDPLKNPENLVLGSSFSNISCASLGADLHISQNFSIITGASLYHYSNGHSVLPNIGMNVISASAGLRYYPNIREKKIRQASDSSNISKKWMFSLRLGYGRHEFGTATKPLGGPSYPVYALTAWAGKRLGRVSVLQAGVFINWYGSFSEYIQMKDFYAGNITAKAAVAGVFIGHEFLFGRLGFVQQAGVNLYKPFPDDYAKLTGSHDLKDKLKRVSSNKLGFHYYLLRNNEIKRFNIFTGIFIKSNLGSADFLEASIGIRF
jgi:hypothetical protein